MMIDGELEKLRADLKAACDAHDAAYRKACALWHDAKVGIEALMVRNENDRIGAARNALISYLVAKHGEAYWKLIRLGNDALQVYSGEAK